MTGNQVRARILFVGATNTGLARLSASFLSDYDRQQQFEILSAECSLPNTGYLHPMTQAMIKMLEPSQTRPKATRLETLYDQSFDHIIVVGEEAVQEYRGGRLRLPNSLRVAVWPFPNPGTLPAHLQPYSFQQTGEYLYSLIGQMTRLPAWAVPSQAGVV